MRSYPKNDLSRYYFKYSTHRLFSTRLPDHTNKRTLDLMNYALNCADSWSTFLDIGAGDGRYSVPLLHKFKRGYAVETQKSEELRDVSSRYPNLHYEKGFIQKSKIKEKIDFVLMADVFEHIPVNDVPKVVKKIGEMQAIGGIVYVLTPNTIYCGPAPQSGLFHTRLKFGHHQQYTKQQLLTLFRPHGYTTIFCVYEDSQVRLLVKHTIMAISMVDKMLCESTVYRIVSYPITFALNIVFIVLSFFARWYDQRHQHDVFQMRSLVLVLKKLS